MKVLLGPLVLTNWLEDCSIFIINKKTPDTRIRLEIIEKNKESSYTAYGVTKNIFSRRVVTCPAIDCQNGDILEIIRTKSSNCAEEKISELVFRFRDEMCFFVHDNIMSPLKVCVFMMFLVQRVEKRNCLYLLAYKRYIKQMVNTALFESCFKNNVIRVVDSNVRDAIHTDNNNHFLAYIKSAMNSLYTVKAS